MRMRMRMRMMMMMMMTKAGVVAAPAALPLSFSCPHLSSILSISSNQCQHLRGRRQHLCSRYTLWNRHQVALAFAVELSDSARENVSDFVKRMEKTWMISKQPLPVSCTSCEASGHLECQWCKGTGFFILGDSMLCEVPSRNTKCRICNGRGLVPCSSCKGTGYRAKWLEKPKPQKDMNDKRHQ